MDPTARLLSSLALCAVVLMVASCQREQANTKSSNDDPPRIAEATLITLERGPDFFSSCPFYKLTIAADGTVTIEPRSYNNQYREKVVSGNTITSRITQEQFKQLLAEFEKADFYSLKDTFDDRSKNSREDCPQHLYDSSSTVTSITVQGKSKEVRHYLGCSGTPALERLGTLESKIDEVGNIQKYFDCAHGENRIDLSNPPTPK